MKAVSSVKNFYKAYLAGLVERLRADARISTEAKMLPFIPTPDEIKGVFSNRSEKNIFRTIEAVVDRLARDWEGGPFLIERVAFHPSDEVCLRVVEAFRDSGWNVEATEKGFVFSAAESIPETGVPLRRLLEE